MELQIGEKIKLMRLKCGLTQADLASRCELTKGYISQLENDLTNPSISTLLDVTTALGSTLKQLFSEDVAEKVVFNKDDYFMKETAGVKQTWLVTNSSKNEMEPIVVALAEGQKTDADMPHEGEEFGFVLEGKLLLHLGEQIFSLKKGDTFYLKSDKVHFLSNNGKTPAKVIWVSSPPNF